MRRSRRSEFVEFVAEQLSFLDGLRLRAMFGGHGVYRDMHMFAIIVDDRLYFKADALTRREFEARACCPFTYVARGRTVTLQYFEAPADVFEDPEVMRLWVDKACAAALRATRR